MKGLLNLVFEEKIKEVNFNPTGTITKVRLDLEPKRENELQKINKIYSKRFLLNNKKFGRTKLIKMAIDNLVKDVEELPEEEGLEYLRTLYREAEF